MHLNQLLPLEESALQNEEEGDRRTLEPAEVGKVGDLERLCAVHEVRQVELARVVPDDEVRVDLLDELAPLRQEVLLALELEHLGPDDVGARVEREDVADEGLALACTRNNRT